MENGLKFNLHANQFVKHLQHFLVQTCLLAKISLNQLILIFTELEILSLINASQDTILGTTKFLKVFIDLDLEIIFNFLAECKSDGTWKHSNFGKCKPGCGLTDADISKIENSRLVGSGKHFRKPGRNIKFYEIRGQF